jgi:hypothetical protein
LDNFAQGEEQFVGPLIELQVGFFEKAAGSIVLEAGGVFLGHTRHDDDGDGLGCGIGLERLEDIEATHFWQEHIKKHEVGRVLAGEAEGLLAIGGADHGVTGSSQSAFGGDPKELAVFDEENLYHL